MPSKIVKEPHYTLPLEGILCEKKWSSQNFCVLMNLGYLFINQLYLFKISCSTLRNVLFISYFKSLLLLDNELYQ